jgi:hypothetical protein
VESIVLSQPISLVKLAHNLIQANITEDGIMIDATVGNGHDTLFLMERAGIKGKVYGFDIQSEAIRSTQARASHHPWRNNLILWQCSHSEMESCIPLHEQGQVKVIMFNLGYLPGGDKAVITHTASTLSALVAAIRLLAANGLLTVLAYPAHVGGDQEADAVHAWCTSLNPAQFAVKRYYLQFAPTRAPVLYTATKLA